MKNLSCLVVALLLTFAWGTVARANEAQTEATPDTEVTDLSSLNLPDAVEEFFTATGEGGEPILAESERAYYAGLPEHARKLVAVAVENDLVSRPEHLKGLLDLDLRPDKFELMFSDNCILCHSDEDQQSEETWMRLDPEADAGPSHLSLPAFLGGAHFRKGLSCSGCHGGSPDVLEMVDEIYDRWPDFDTRREDRTWIPEFCGRCHSDPAFMRGYNPALATDQVAKYRTSRHGKKLLEEGDSGVAQCVSCHGVHGILGPQSRNSPVHPQAIPETCGRCHSDVKLMEGRTKPDGTAMPTDQLAQYRESVHGKALLERGDLGAPACNDCHGNHAAMPPEVSHVSQVCRTCHTMNAKLFDGSKHKRAFEKNQWPECETCHGKHNITKTFDAMLGTQPGELCYNCHARYAKHNPNCIATADHFRETIQTLAEAEEHFAEKEEWMAEHGLDAGDLEGVRADLHDALRTARSTVHAFDQSDFDEVAKAGLDAVKVGHEKVSAGESEFHYRRRGLVIAILVLVFLAVVLALKIREIERPT